mgnify:CR=1 FL=1
MYRQSGCGFRRERRYHLRHLKPICGIGTGSTPDSILATVDFTSFTCRRVEHGSFLPPISLIVGRYYWAQVFFLRELGVRGFSFTQALSFRLTRPPSMQGQTARQRPVTAPLYMALPGPRSLQAFHSSWYGVDVLVDDGSSTVGPVAGDDVGIADSVVVVRSGLPTTVHATEQLLMD